MSDEKTDVSELLADSIAREKTLRAYLSESNQARIKLEALNDVIQLQLKLTGDDVFRLRHEKYALEQEHSELEQEMADLNREIAGLKNNPPYSIPQGPERVSWWDRIDKFIKRLAK